MAVSDGSKFRLWKIGFTKNIERESEEKMDVLLIVTLSCRGMKYKGFSKHSNSTTTLEPKQLKQSGPKRLSSRNLRRR